MEFCSLPVVYLGPNYGGGNEDNGDLFKTSHAHTATPSAPNPTAGLHRPMPPLQIPGHSWTSLGQSLVGSLLLSPGPWGTPGPLCALPESVFPALCKFWQLYGGLKETSSKRAYAIPRSAAPRGLSLLQSTADLYLLRRHPDTVLAQSLWGLWVLVHTNVV